MVSNSVLSAFCVEMGLYKFLDYDNKGLAGTIPEYIDKIEKARAQEEAAARAEKRLMGQYWTDIEAPKVRTRFDCRRLVSMWPVGSFDQCVNEEL